MRMRLSSCIQVNITDTDVVNMRLEITLQILSLLKDLTVPGIFLIQQFIC